MGALCCHGNHSLKFKAFPLPKRCYGLILTKLGPLVLEIYLFKIVDDGRQSYIIKKLTLWALGVDELKIIKIQK